MFELAGLKLVAVATGAPLRGSGRRPTPSLDNANMWSLARSARPPKRGLAPESFCSSLTSLFPIIGGIGFGGLGSHGGGSGDVPGKVPKARGVPHRFSRRRLIVSVGTLLFLGWSKAARLSKRRLFRVLPSLASSGKAVGTLRAMEPMP